MASPNLAATPFSWTWFSALTLWPSWSLILHYWWHSESWAKCIEESTIYYVLRVKIFDCLWLGSKCKQMEVQMLKAIFNYKMSASHLWWYLGLFSLFSLIQIRYILAMTKTYRVFFGQAALDADKLKMTKRLLFCMTPCMTMKFEKKKIIIRRRIFISIIIFN